MLEKTNKKISSHITSKIIIIIIIIIIHKNNLTDRQHLLALEGLPRKKCSWRHWRALGRCEEFKFSKQVWGCSLHTMALWHWRAGQPGLHSKHTERGHTVHWLPAAPGDLPDPAHQLHLEGQEVLASHLWHNQAPLGGLKEKQNALVSGTRVTCPACSIQQWNITGDGFAAKMGCRQQLP